MDNLYEVQVSKKKDSSGTADVEKKWKRCGKAPGKWRFHAL